MSVIVLKIFSGDIVPDLFLKKCYFYNIKIPAKTRMSLN